ncbi:hypothetical protein RSAG8_02228, partial [Rhizoctonia solani AG-8 WAC10335]
MKFLTIFSTVLLASVAHGASSHARRAAADSVIYPELIIADVAGCAAKYDHMHRAAYNYK